MLLYQIALYINSFAIAVFIAIEIFWFVKLKSSSKRIPSLFSGFLFYNLPFLLLALSMYLQQIPEGWVGVLRLVFLLLSIPVNTWLHYHLDKGGNSVGMAHIFFLIGAVPLVIAIEILIAFN